MRGPFSCLFLLAGIVAAAPVDIPFHITRGMILVDAAIQGSGRPMHLILDSGAGATVLAKRVAEELDLALTDTESVRTVDGVENASRAQTTHISLGSSSNLVRFSPCPLVIDLSSESRTLGTPIDGLLGADFFEGRSIKIDFKNSSLHVSPAGKPGSQATKLTLSRSRGAMFVGLTAADSSLQRVRLDTGCCRALCWTPPDGSTLRRSWRDGKTTKVDVNFGPLVMSGIPTDIYRKPLFAGEDGLLGTALLSRFDSIWIDSVNNRIAFEIARN